MAIWNYQSRRLLRGFLRGTIRDAALAAIKNNIEITKFWFIDAKWRKQPIEKVQPKINYLTIWFQDDKWRKPLTDKTQPGLKMGSFSETHHQIRCRSGP